MKRLAVTVLIILLAALIGAGAYVYNLLDRIPKAALENPDTGGKLSEDSEQRKAELGISENALTQKDTGVTNILLFGLDKRKQNEPGHSDAILIASIDRRNKQIKLTSLMRDMYVDIPGKKDDRINTAYFSGGPSLAIKTVNTNFDMNIEDYVTVDFFALEQIIDLVGGIDIDVKKNEVSAMKPYIYELNTLRKDDENVDYITRSGLQTLNGRQAVAYARFRNVSGDDFYRTERQRLVLNELLKKSSSISVTRIPELVNTVLPNVETSLSSNEIVGLGATILGFGKQDIKQFRIPTDDGYSNETIDSKMVLVPDLEKNTELLHEFIYGTKSSYAADDTEGINQ